MLATLHFQPQRLWMYASDGRLPAPHNRVARTPDPLDDFPPMGDGWNLPRMERATVVLRGRSFDERRLAELDGPLFLVNWPHSIDRKDTYYATGDQNDVATFAANGMFPILYVQVLASPDVPAPVRPATAKVFEDRQNIHLKMLDRHQTPMPELGSSLCVIPAVAHSARHLDIHGWDHYLSRNPINDGYWARLLSMLCTCPNRYSLVASCIYRAIYNFHYGHRFAEHPRIANHGLSARLADMSSPAGKRLAGKFDRVFYQA
jgi:hypothetical protein